MVRPRRPGATARAPSGPRCERRGYVTAPGERPRYAGPPLAGSNPGRPPDVKTAAREPPRAALRAASRPTGARNPVSADAPWPGAGARSDDASRGTWTSNLGT